MREMGINETDAQKIMMQITKIDGVRQESAEKKVERIDSREQDDFIEEEHRQFAKALEDLRRQMKVASKGQSVDNFSIPLVNAKTSCYQCFKIVNRAICTEIDGRVID